MGLCLNCDGQEKVNKNVWVLHWNLFFFMPDNKQVSARINSNSHTIILSTMSCNRIKYTRNVLIITRTVVSSKIQRGRRFGSPWSWRRLWHSFYNCIKQRTTSSVEYKSQSILNTVTCYRRWQRGTASSIDLVITLLWCMCSGVARLWGALVQQ